MKCHYHKEIEFVQVCKVCFLPLCVACTDSETNCCWICSLELKNEVHHEEEAEKRREISRDIKFVPTKRITLMIKNNLKASGIYALSIFVIMKSVGSEMSIFSNSILILLFIFGCFLLGYIGLENIGSKRMNLLSIISVSTCCIAIWVFCLLSYLSAKNNLQSCFDICFGPSLVWVLDFFSNPLAYFAYRLYNKLDTTFYYVSFAMNFVPSFLIWTGIETRKMKLNNSSGE
jgi:hypothetical protein